MSALNLPLRAKTRQREEKQVKCGNCGAICFNLEYQPHVAHESVQPHPAWNIARLKREAPPSARELFPPPIYTAHQFIRSVEKSSEGSHPKRAAPRHVFRKRPRLCADRDETERSGSFVLYLYELELRDVFRQGARLRLCRLNEKGGKCESAGNGKGRW